MISTSNEAIETARNYYNSDDADNFYALVWGGEDIHIGIYRSHNDSISEASQRTVERMASYIRQPSSQMRVLDLGSGYGGAARYLARRFGCKVIALNLSEVENKRARDLNDEAGLHHLIEVIDGSFESIPFEDGSFDLIWSQDAMLHSANRSEVMAEATRVLKKGGQFLFTDPMQASDCPDGVLDPILQRIHLRSLASPGFYRQESKKHGLREEGFEDLSDELVNHYARVLAETEKRSDELCKRISAEYVERMKSGLGHWITGGRDGHLVWGIFRFEKI